VEKAVFWVHRLLRTDPTDGRNTWRENGRFYIPGRYDEYTASNTLHFALTIVVLAIAAFAGPRIGWGVFIYILCVVGAFVLFCVVLKWSLWATRYHLPVFELFCPVTGLVLARWGRPGKAWARRVRPAIVGCIAAALLAGAVPFAIMNDLRPLIGPKSVFSTSRESQYFAGCEELTLEYQSVADALHRAGIREVGLGMMETDSEYPLWILLRDRLGDPVRLEHMYVLNASAGLEELPIHPQAFVQWSGPIIARRLLLGRPKPAGETASTPSAPTP
jgi:hypothetical protein